MKTIGLLFISCLFFACSESNKNSQKEQAEVLQALPVSLKKGNIKHTVMFSLKSDIESAETKKFLQDGQQILSALPTVQNFEVFCQVSGKNNYQFYFSMIFTDQAAYDAYNEHPEHVKFVKERWETEVADFQEADFVTIE